MDEREARGKIFGETKRTRAGAKRGKGVGELGVALRGDSKREHATDLWISSAVRPFFTSPKRMSRAFFFSSCRRQEAR